MNQRTRNKKKDGPGQEFIEGRRAALLVAQYQHKEATNVKRLVAKIEAAKQAALDAKFAVPKARVAVGEAEAKLNTYLEQYIPEELRKVKK